jgi:hypothetical protein
MQLRMKTRVYQTIQGRTLKSGQAAMFCRFAKAL